ncbi:MAG: hypothetical protein KBG84_01305 [Planctomycetes bacterium]|nr:hypothetical protein [Planctomycetota bacterium]
MDNPTHREFGFERKGVRAVVALGFLAVVLAGLSLWVLWPTPTAPAAPSQTTDSASPPALQFSDSGKETQSPEEQPRSSLPLKGGASLAVVWVTEAPVIKAPIDVPIAHEQRDEAYIGAFYGSVLQLPKDLPAGAYVVQDTPNVLFMAARFSVSSTGAAEVVQGIRTPEGTRLGAAALCKVRVRISSADTSLQGENVSVSFAGTVKNPVLGKYLPKPELTSSAVRAVGDEFPMTVVRNRNMLIVKGVDQAIHRVSDSLGDRVPAGDELIEIVVGRGLQLRVRVVDSSEGAWKETLAFAAELVKKRRSSRPAEDAPLSEIAISLETTYFVGSKKTGNDVFKIEKLKLAEVKTGGVVYEAVVMLPPRNTAGLLSLEIVPQDARMIPIASGAVLVEPMQSEAQADLLALSYGWGGTIRVRDVAGTPVKDYRLMFRLDFQNPEQAADKKSWRLWEAVTDAAGEVSLSKLPAMPGMLVDIRAAAGSSKAWQGRRGARITVPFVSLATPIDVLIELTDDAKGSMAILLNFDGIDDDAVENYLSMATYLVAPSPGKGATASDFSNSPLRTGHRLFTRISERGTYLVCVGGLLGLIAAEVDYDPAVSTEVTIKVPKLERRKFRVNGLPDEELRLLPAPIDDFLAWGLSQLPEPELRQLFFASLPRGSAGEFILPVAANDSAGVSVVSVSRGLLTARKVETAGDGTVVLSELEPTFRNELNVQLKTADAQQCRVLLTPFFVETGSTLSAITALGANMAGQDTVTLIGMPPGKYAVLGLVLLQTERAPRSATVRWSRIVQIGTGTQSKVVLDE